MKDITLRITGSQQFDGTEEEQLEFVTEGKLYTRNGSVYLVYDESEVSGMPGCKTTLKVGPDSVKMRRTGGEGFGTEMVFREGERFTSVYKTPYGTMGLEILTSDVSNRLDMESLTGSVDIEYAVSLSGQLEGKNRLSIQVN